MEHIAISRQNLPKFIISGQDAQFSNIIFDINKLDLLWVSNFMPLEIYFLFGTNFFWNERSILALMLNVCYLVVILTFLMVTLVVTARYLPYHLVLIFVLYIYIYILIMYSSLTCYLGIYVFPYACLVAPTY